MGKYELYRKTSCKKVREKSSKKIKLIKIFFYKKKVQFKKINTIKFSQLNIVICLLEFCTSTKRSEIVQLSQPKIADMEKLLFFGGLAAIDFFG